MPTGPPYPALLLAVGQTGHHLLRLSGQSVRRDVAENHLLLRRHHVPVQSDSRAGRQAAEPSAHKLYVNGSFQTILLLLLGIPCDLIQSELYCPNIFSLVS